ncbi:MAG: NADH-quinone oxidoreductase subunit A [Phycisphaerae bacterium]
MLLASIEPYAAIGITILMVTLIALIILILGHTLGPRRHGPVKDTAYESGVPLIADTERRFNVRFYIVAMLFLLFDVEVIFMWPWAQVYYQAATTGTSLPVENGDPVGKGFLLIGMGIFFALLVFGLLYEWRKGAFQWD